MSRERKDLAGKKYNHLTVVRRGDDYIPPNGKAQPTWWCLCDCQLELPEEARRPKRVNQTHLVSGKVKSCGCNKFRATHNFVDLTGRKFGKFTVVKQVSKPETCTSSGTYWLCRCECGNLRVYRAADINRQSALSCGKCSRNIFDISNEYGVGLTTNKQEFYFDLDDYSKIKGYTWCINSDGYVVAWDRNIGKFIYMHRLVTGLTFNDGYDVDHKNHKTNDNQKENLRVCTHQENSRNASISKNNTSGATGVVWVSNENMWQAQIMVDGKTIDLLHTVDFYEAVKARKSAEDKYFGEYSYANSTKGKTDCYEETN